MYKIIIAIGVFGSSLWSCSEYNNSFEATAPENPTTENTPTIPVSNLKNVKTIESDYSLLSTTNYTGENITINGDYAKTTVYDENGDATANISVFFDFPSMALEMNSYQEIQNYIGNVAYQTNENTTIQLGQQTTNKSEKIIYKFLKKDFVQYVVNNNTLGSVSNDINITEIKNEIVNENNVSTRNTITLKYDKDGNLTNGSVLSEVNNELINFILYWNDKQITKIDFQQNDMNIGTLKFSYDRNVNPFTLNHVDNIKTIRTIQKMLLVGLKINPEKKLDYNLLNLSNELMRLSEFSSNNLTKLVLDDTVILNKMFQYDSQGYPTQANISQKTTALDYLIPSGFGDVSSDFIGTDQYLYY